MHGHLEAGVDRSVSYARLATPTLSGAGRGTGEAVLIQPNGAILVGASATKPTRPVTLLMALARFIPDGSADFEVRHWRR
jgi:hypothetical protein